MVTGKKICHGVGNEKKLFIFLYNKHLLLMCHGTKALIQVTWYYGDRKKICHGVGNEKNLFNFLYNKHLLLMCHGTNASSSIVSRGRSKIKKIMSHI